MKCLCERMAEVERRWKSNKIKKVMKLWDGCWMGANGSLKCPIMMMLGYKFHKDKDGICLSLCLCLPLSLSLNICPPSSTVLGTDKAFLFNFIYLCIYLRQGLTLLPKLDEVQWHNHSLLLASWVARTIGALYHTQLIYSNFNFCRDIWRLWAQAMNQSCPPKVPG